LLLLLLVVVVVVVENRGKKKKVEVVEEEEENDSRNVFRNPLFWKRVFVACTCAFRTFLSLVQKSCSSFRPQCCNSAQCASGRGRRREL